MTSILNGLNSGKRRSKRDLCASFQNPPNFVMPVSNCSGTLGVDRQIADFKILELISTVCERRGKNRCYAEKQRIL